MKASVLELDAQLMIGVKEGDELCMEMLLARHRERIIHFLWRMVQNQAIAEELAQDAFLRVYRSRARYEPTARFTTWLYHIATHLALNWLRDRRHERRHEYLDDHDDDGLGFQIPDHRPRVDQTIIHKVKLDEVRSAVAELPPRQRAVVLMHKYEGMEYSQIAVALGCSPQSVKSLIFRAYERLRVRLAHMADV
jgi:RNA polymerase sigma-70 factor (ECF subfamily)